jgi:plasmid stabilization system protein ParE
MKIIWSPRARRDLRRISAYLNRRNPKAGREIVSLVRKAADMLGEFPQAGPESRHPGIRLLQVPTTTYALPYRQRANQLEILSVFDQRRDPEDMP